MLSSGWLASYVGQSEVPALITLLSNKSIVEHGVHSRVATLMQPSFQIKRFFLNSGKLLEGGKEVREVGKKESVFLWKKFPGVMGVKTFFFFCVIKH